MAIYGKIHIPTETCTAKWVLFCPFLDIYQYPCWFVGWLIILTPGVGWDIMGYESETLPSYPVLSNFSYSVNLITPLPRLFLRFVYLVLIPSEHHPDRPWHPLRLCAYCIDRAPGHPLRYGPLILIDVHPDGVDPRGVHRLLYRWVLPLSACPVFLCHPCDPSRCPMVEFRQYLEHIPGHHPAISDI